MFVIFNFESLRVRRVVSKIDERLSKGEVVDPKMHLKLSYSNTAKLSTFFLVPDGNRDILRKS